MMKRYKQSQTDELSEILKNDGVISVPTDTVYGVCARIDSHEAYNNLVNTKKRPSSKLFPVMCANMDQIRKIAKVDERTEKIINNFMPGPITIVLEKNSSIPEYITNGKNTIAIRMATSKSLEELIEKTGSPIFMSSANHSGEPICESLEEIENTFPKIDGIMEGNVSIGEVSTIVDCTSDTIKILRQGPITIEQINDSLK